MEMVIRVGNNGLQWIEFRHDRRGGKRKAEVLVKWQGYDEPSWIEESDVDAEALKTMLAEWKLEMDRQQGKGRKSRMRRRKEDV
jgi:hypothetical protein